jgi:GH35 family endo-1,4-beta-xylanase
MPKYPIRIMLSVAVACALVMGMVTSSVAQAQPSYISFTAEDGHFPLAMEGIPTPLYIHEDDHAGAIRAAHDLQADIERVTHSAPVLTVGRSVTSTHAVIIGTYGKSPLIDQIIEAGHLDASELEGRRETYFVTPVDNPIPGVERALVIAGSDMRGTIYGIYDVSREIGVSPWYYWADVPTVHRADLFVRPGRHTRGEPFVKYRGIFINNENPSLLGWVEHTFGGFGHEFYENVFELILRLRGNFLWPAMWGKAFYDDDPLNAVKADMYGVVIGTSHHEPMGRAHVEWARYGEGPWDYEANKDRLQSFWREGVRRMGDTEGIVTLGMRGDGDEPMSAEAEVELLERIIRDQREMIAQEMGRPVDEVPQMWALYKEVQEYYEQGLRPPDDVMILIANDNWGNVRLLPPPEDVLRDGGYGMYYHFDYVGGPRNYKWINTVQIERTWEQMQRTYEHGVDQMALVNVGDIKPMEFPITFFLEHAWNPDAMPLERMANYSVEWAARTFPPRFAQDIGHLLSQYTRFNSRRKPEMLSPETYSLDNYREFERIVDDFDELVRIAERVRRSLPAEYDDAFYQLVMYPVEAAANVNRLYLAVAKNHRYASQGRAATTAMADEARRLFARDAELSDYYNNEMSDGKWRHMMDQTRIGYTYWQQPEENVMPAVHEIELQDAAGLGVALEGTAEWWPGDGAPTGPARLPEFDPFARQEHYIEVFNRGRSPLMYTVNPSETWVHVSSTGGTTSDQDRIIVSIDWGAAPYGVIETDVVVTSQTGESVSVAVPVRNPEDLQRTDVAGFIESNGYIAMEGPDFTRAVAGQGVSWTVIPGLGRTESSVTVKPFNATTLELGPDSPRLEYTVNVHEPGPVRVHVCLSPTLPYDGGDGFRYGVSFGEGPVEIVNMHEGYDNPLWYEWVGSNINIKTSEHTLATAGEHTLNFWLIDPGVVIQRIVVDTGGLPDSYLGPPRSFHGGAAPQAVLSVRNDLSEVLSLAEAFRDHFMVGAAVNDRQMSGRDAIGAAVTARHFNTITNENVLKWGLVHPQPGVFDFDAADRFVDFGEANDMFIVGHTLVWHSQTPAWVFQDENGDRISRDALIERMRDHIHTIVGRYRGRVHAWDVVNEAVINDGSMRQTPWLEIIGEEFIEMAFRFAHEADPDAELYYNDYSLEHAPKRAGVIRLVRDLIEKGVPISGVGSQGHLLLEEPTLEEIEASVVELGSLGIPVMITELDVAVLERGFTGADVGARPVATAATNPYADGLPAEVEARFTERYRDIFDVYARHAELISRVTFWGVADGDSWLNNWPIRGRTDYPLLFDRGHQPKEAFHAVVEVARQ